MASFEAEKDMILRSENAKDPKGKSDQIIRYDMKLYECLICRDSANKSCGDLCPSQRTDPAVLLSMQHVTAQIHKTMDTHGDGGLDQFCFS